MFKHLFMPWTIQQGGSSSSLAWSSCRRAGRALLTPNMEEQTRQGFLCFINPSLYRSWPADVLFHLKGIPIGTCPKGKVQLLCTKTNRCLHPTHICSCALFIYLICNLLTFGCIIHSAITWIVLLYILNVDF